MCRATRQIQFRITIVPGREETRNFPNVVAVECTVNAGERHCQQAIAYVGKVQIKVVLSVNESPLAL